MSAFSDAQGTPPLTARLCKERGAPFGPPQILRPSTPDSVTPTKRMLAFKGPAQPSPTLGDALNAGYLYLEVRCLGCDTHQTVALDIVRRPKTT